MKLTTIFTATVIFTIIGTGIFSCRIGDALKNPQKTLIENISATRTFDNNYIFELSPEGHWEIYTGPRAGEIDWQKKLAEVDGTYLSIVAPHGKGRSFFGVVSPKGDTVVISERQIPMEGQINFRDLGGLPAGKMRYVKWGQLFRSGNLAELTDDDLVYFSNIGIRTVIDLRNDLETGEKPDRLPDGVSYYQYSISDKEGKAFTKLKRMVLKEGYRREKAKALFVDVMRTFADSMASDAQPIFDILLTENGATPMLYHCTGGKDRTGFVTALILSSLGVERDIIMQDYLMSNYYRRDMNLKNVKKARLIGLDQETLEYALQVREEYLNSVFEVMDEHGGTDAYLEKKFGLTETERKILIEKYTVPFYGWTNNNSIDDKG